MARIKIDAPDHFSFHTSFPVRITDLNYGGHVGNDTVLSLIHEARVQFLQHHGYKELDIEGKGLIMADAAIEFKAELFYGDVVEAYVLASDFSKIGFDIFYKFEKVVDEKKILVALAKTGMICYDYAAKKIAVIPEVVKQKLVLATS